MAGWRPFGSVRLDRFDCKFYGFLRYKLTKVFFDDIASVKWTAMNVEITTLAPVIGGPLSGVFKVFDEPVTYFLNRFCATTLLDSWQFRERSKTGFH